MIMPRPAGSFSVWIAERLQDQASEVDHRNAVLLVSEAQALPDQKIQNLLAFRESVAAGLENPTFEDKLS
jgi:hypothetical protein